jgi:hypothetical protein
LWISGNLGGAADTGITFWLKLRPEKPLKFTSTVAQEDSIGSCLKLTKKTTKVAFKIQAISLLPIITFSLTFQECVLTSLFAVLGFSRPLKRFNCFRCASVPPQGAVAKLSSYLLRAVRYLERS